MALNPNQLKSLQSGAHGDGHGLYLVVRDSGDRAWAYRFTSPVDGKRAQMEFGKLADYTLSAARDKAREYRLSIRDRIDPRPEKNPVEPKDDGTTFKAFADEQYPAWCEGCSLEEVKQWKRSIADVPTLHDLKLHEITTEHVLAALKPIWTAKPVTASRTRQRIERLMDAANALKKRTGENPATWRGNLKSLLPSPRKLNREKRKRTGRTNGHLSIPYDKAPALMTALRYEPGNAPRCVEVGVLTVTRSQEIRLMEWTELDLDNKKTWLIPAAKMKIKGEDNPKDHLVPLSDQAIELIRAMPRVGTYVFPSDHVEDHQPFFPNALTNVIKRCKFNGTMHGMRSTFRNWGADNEEHNFRREVLEFCLSHRVGDEAELAYWDSDMIKRRREVLQAWADYVKPKQAKPALKVVA